MGYIYVYVREYFSIIHKRHNRFYGNSTHGGSFWPVFHFSAHTAFFLMEANLGKLMCAPSNLQPAATLTLSYYPNMCAPSLYPPVWLGFTYWSCQYVGSSNFHSTMLPWAFTKVTHSLYAFFSLFLSPNMCIQLSPYHKWLRAKFRGFTLICISV